MLEKLKAIEARLTEVERQLSDPASYADRERLTALSREQKELTPVVACYRAYAQAVQTAEDAAAMLSDPELHALAQEELSAARAEQEVELTEAVEAPVEAGQRLGTLRIRSGEAVVAELPLVAAAPVPRLTFWESAKRVLRAAVGASV